MEYVQKYSLAQRFRFFGEALSTQQQAGSTPQIYFFHPDHLDLQVQKFEKVLCEATRAKRSATMLSDANGDPYQFFLNLPFGEMMTEQTNGAYNNPYKFNDYGGESYEIAFNEHTERSSELDQETGFYYYGARYYNPRTSIWLSVDPIAVYNPVYEVEHYIDGQHNGGVFNNGNLDVYGYTYKNPIIYVDPNGKQSKVTGSKVRKVSTYYSMKNNQGTRDLIYQRTHETRTKSGYDESMVIVVDNDGGGEGNEVFSGPNAVSEYNKKASRGELKVFDKDVDTYDINSKEFQNTKRTINNSVAIEAFLKKLPIADGIKGLLELDRAKTGPIAPISPNDIDVAIDANTVADAKYKLLTLGVGNSVDIPYRLSDVDEFNYDPADHPFGLGGVNILFKGIDSSGNPIFKTSELPPSGIVSNDSN